MKRSKNGIREADRGGSRLERRDHNDSRNGNSAVGGRTNSRRSRSRSPIKSKLMALAMSSASASKSKGAGGGGEKSRRERESSRDREMNLRRMRMDELDEKRSSAANTTKRARSPVVDNRRPPSGAKTKSATALDKVVKKAREQRSNYWDKKILEVEEKDPMRWGHSGFKELYQKDFKRGGGGGGSPKRNRRSRSGSSPRRNFNRSPSPRFTKRRHSLSQSRSKSRSRSPNNRPTGKSKKHGQRSFSRSNSPDFSPAKGRGRGNGTERSKDGKMKGRGQSSLVPSGSRQSRGGVPQKGKRQSGVSMKSSQSNSGKGGGISGRKLGRRSPSFSSSESSVSRSRSRSFSSAKRPSTAFKSSKAKGGLRNVKRSDSMSSSASSSSSDEDVLQIHAKGKGRSDSLSYSDSESSSSVAARGRRNARGGRSSSSGSSSSASGSSSESDSDESVRTKPKNSQPTPTANASKEKVPAKPLKVAPSQQKQVVGKSPVKKANPVNGSSAPANANKTAKPVVKKVQTLAAKKNPPSAAGENNKTALTTKAKTNTVKASPKVAEKEKSPPAKKPPAKVKSASESGETESETESSSDSDSEPRMTLSERFAKLAQMSTDKREMAKPILAVNEIDTKMRVVKDFRNPEIPKVYVTGQGAAMAQEKARLRPRSPPQYPQNEGEKRFASEERRRHFERMYRDEPAERPLDWSDIRVRYNYYKERGCFDERPINLDEYAKWEEWYMKYREWLEQEGYYERMAAASGGGNGGRPPPQQGGGPLQNNNWQYGQGERIRQQNYGRGGRRVEDGPPLSSRAHFGRPEGNAYLHGNIGRRIDRTPGGSLVVNIRGNNNQHNMNHYEPRGGRRLGGIMRR